MGNTVGWETEEEGTEGKEGKVVKLKVLFVNAASPVCTFIASIPLVVDHFVIHVVISSLLLKLILPASVES